MGTQDVDLYAVWTRTFKAQRADNNAWYTIDAELLASGSHCIVYGDKSLLGSRFTIANAQAIVSEYETYIYTPITGAFGNIEDIDENGKVILLLLDIKDGYAGTGGYVAGYFDPTHMFATGTYSNSNEADMLFLDVYPQPVASAGFYATIAHELQHLINFSNTYVIDGTEQELWINEGLSSGAEYIYGGHQQDKIAYFNVDPIGTIAYGNNFFVWDGYWEQDPDIEDTLANYATAYLFFQWLRIHASNDTGIYKEIIDSSYRDYRAVTEAAASRIGSFTGWGDLLSTWMIANAACEPAGFYGYQGEIVTEVGFFDRDLFNWPFSPGEGIISYLGNNGGSLSNTAGSGSHIKYVGLSFFPSPVVPDATLPYTGAYLLTYNANTNPEGLDEYGILANYRGSANAAAMSVRGNVRLPENSLPSSYPLGFADINRADKAGKRNVPAKPARPGKK
jgi:hypothetical protein